MARMTWVDLYSFGNTTVQLRKIEHSTKYSKDRKQKYKQEREPILVECEILPPKQVLFVLRLYSNKAKVKEYNLPRKTITVV